MFIVLELDAGGADVSLVLMIYERCKSWWCLC